MKKLLVVFVALFATAAFAAETVTPSASGASNTAVVSKSKKAKKKGKKKGHGKKHKAAAPAAEPAAPAPEAAAPPADGAAH